MEAHEQPRRALLLHAKLFRTHAIRKGCYRPYYVLREVTEEVECGTRGDSCSAPLLDSRLDRGLRTSVPALPPAALASPFCFVFLTVAMIYTIQRCVNVRKRNSNPSRNSNIQRVCFRSNTYPNAPRFSAAVCGRSDPPPRHPSTTKAENGGRGSKRYAFTCKQRFVEE